MSVERRRQTIEPDHPRLSIARQCELMSISRSGFSYQPAGETPLNLELMRLIDAQFLEAPWYGARQMARHLRREGYVVGRKRVRRLMAKMGLAPIYQRPRTTVPHPERRAYPYLLRDGEQRPGICPSTIFGRVRPTPSNCFNSRNAGFSAGRRPGIGTYRDSFENVRITRSLYLGVRARGEREPNDAEHWLVPEAPPGVSGYQETWQPARSVGIGGRGPSDDQPPITVGKMAESNHLAFWGKARPAADYGPRCHPNAYHALDVAAAAEALLTAGISRTPPPWFGGGHEAAIVALIALHDFGKFSRPFQAKAQAHWPSQLSSLSAPPDPGHGAVGYAMLTDRFADLVDPILPGWPPSARAPLIGAICGHHGRPVAELNSVFPRVVCAACQRAARDFATDAFAVLRPAGLPAPPDDPDPALAWWLAGLTVLADWIGSAEAWFRYHAPDLDLARYWHEIARPQAVRAVGAAGLAPAAVRAQLTLADLVDNAAVAPSPVQRMASSLDLGAAGPVAVLVEDQTGSGKTEAALLLAHRLMAVGRAEGVFVALPTMATANAMYDRLAAAYRRLFADDARPSLVLAHGRRDDHAGFQNSILADAAVAGTAADDPADEPASAQCAAWLADDRRRAFLAHVGVGTIDQALLAVLPTRHAPLRLLGLHRRVLIVDEAHAYDAYMGEELRRLMTFQAGLGGSTIILSATLPQQVRAGLAGAFAAGRGAKGPPLAEQAYPLITVLRDDAAEEHPCPGRERLARSVAVTRLAGIEEALERVVTAAQAGAAVAWLRNAVDDAVEAHAALAARGVAATLFHARFAIGDRQTVESDVLRRFGKDSEARAGVVVATQVIEQSLDLDFDLMVTDLAPIDLLIQRAGRVWRHARDARPVSGPSLLVLAPEPVAAPAADWLGPTLRRTGRVYQDHALLWRSASVLFATGAIAAPDDVRRLVEAVYAPDGEVPSGLQRRAAEAEGRDSAALSVARQNLLSWRDGYHLNAGAWASDIRTPTRLGEQSTLFRLARWEGGVLRPWYDGAGAARAWALSELSLPPWVASGVPKGVGALAAAETAVRRDWDAWAQDIPILALAPEGDAWTGELERDRKVVRVSYGSRDGLRQC